MTIGTIGYIYIVTNTVNGKHYVGQTTVSVEQRWKDHVRCSNGIRAASGCPVLYAAMQKYGVDAFTVNVAECRVSTQNELDAKEVAAIRSLNTLVPNGYNLRSGGCGGATHHDTKLKLSAAHKGIVQSDESRRKRSEAMIGKRHSDETKEKMRAFHKTRVMTPEWRARIGEAGTGRRHSEATLSKMRDGRRKGSVPGTAGRHHSEETRKKQSAAAIKVWAKRKMLTP